MIDKMPDDATVGLLNRTLDRTSVRAAVAASNIANVETPGYRAMRAEFQEAIRLANDSLESTRGAGGRGAAALPDERVVIREAPITRMRADGNTVDIDAEMTQLASLGGRFQAAAQLLRKRFALFRYALTGGRG